MCMMYIVAVARKSREKPAHGKDSAGVGVRGNIISLYNNMWNSIKENKDLLVVAAASFFIGFGAASFFNSPSLKEKDDVASLLDEANLPPLPFTDKENDEDSSSVILDDSSKSTKSSLSGANVLAVEAQRAGSKVHMERVVFTEPAWVVVRESSQGAPGNILGAGWFPMGTHLSVDVELLRSTMGGEKYYAVIYQDAGGDKKFNHTIDSPLKGEDGKEIMVTFSTLASPADSN